MHGTSSVDHRSGASLSHEYKNHLYHYYILCIASLVLLWIVSLTEYYTHPVFSSVLLNFSFDKHKSALSAI